MGLEGEGPFVGVDVVDGCWCEMGDAYAGFFGADGVAGSGGVEGDGAEGAVPEGELGCLWGEGLVGARCRRGGGGLLCRVRSVVCAVFFALRLEFG